MQAHAGDVLALAQHGHADGVDAGHGGFDEMQDDVEIVDHDIEHNADIEAAPGIGR